MLKKKRQSEVAFSPLIKKDTPDIIEPPTDTLTVKILSLQVPDEPPVRFAIKVTFFDQLILSTIIKSIGGKDAEQNNTLAEGTMDYDPSDYEKMCLFANYPLVVHVHPLKSMDLTTSGQPTGDTPRSSVASTTVIKTATDVSCCNIDILPIFLSSEEKSKLCIRKRMEPLITPSALQRKCWDCLPLLTMELTVVRQKDNAEHHKILKDSNWMKITLIGSYNMIMPFDNDYVYTAATNTVLNHEANTVLAAFNQGYVVPRRFDPFNFYPKWESLRVDEDLFTKGDDKFMCKLEDIQNADNIDINYFIKQKPLHTVLWGSFHRSLLLQKSSEDWLSKHIRKFKWPLEVHIYGENDGHSFMAFMNLFQLLYPGETTVRLAVPLQWINPVALFEECYCQPLLTPNEKSTLASGQKASRTDTTPSGSTDVPWPPPCTGADDNDAFAIIEVKLKRPLRKRVIPTQIFPDSIHSMLKEMEKISVKQRRCTGRGQLTDNWQATVRATAMSLRKVPYYGPIEFCSFNRQLSETRTRVELITSSWQDAAIYVNNNFVVQQYLRSEEGKDKYEEMLMMAHACLMKVAGETLLGETCSKEPDVELRAARQARQMQDTKHAVELYLQATVKQPNDAHCWRELSTCLKDVDRDWANVCLNKAVVMNPRHPLTLISKGGMVFETDPIAAEIFFVAVMAFYPFWSTAWVIASAYYFYRGQYILADKILEMVKKNQRVGMTEDLGYARAWERELGDWWDATPILPGTDSYCDAADLLLRLRCVTLAEICVARLLMFAGESPCYYHLVALCCRLKEDYKEALCHLRVAQEKYGVVSYLKSLEAECLHKLNDIPASLVCYEKAGPHGSAYSTLMSLPINTDLNRMRGALVELVRRQPSAYVWLALAENWITAAKDVDEKGDEDKTEEQMSATRCAAACAVEALKWDRRAAKAWLLLAKIVKPSARRYHCLKMAALYGYNVNEDCVESDTQSQQTTCYHLGVAITACLCPMCERMRL